MEMAKFLTKLTLKVIGGIIVLNSAMVTGVALWKAGELNGQRGAKPFGEDEEEAEAKIE